MLFLVDLVRSCRVYRATKQVDIDERHPNFGIIEKILSTLILLSGLGAFAYGAADPDSFKDVYATSGGLIWVGLDTVLACRRLDHTRGCGNPSKVGIWRLVHSSP